MAYGSVLTDVVQSSTAGTPPQFNDGNGTQVGTLCRAWVNFNGTTSPGTVRASFNVTSVTKNGTGDYTVNLTNAMSDVNFVTVVSGGANTAYAAQPSSTSTAQVTSRYVSSLAGATTALDSNNMQVAIFR